jgi:endogenous inhibitor of DNA gyrase (YacG/DUF329 family)
MKQSAIAAVIERDLLRSNDSPLITTVQCFSCGHGMTYRRSRFCSDRCREWFDAGSLAYQSTRIVYRDRAGNEMRVGRAGFMIRCAHCAKEFESKGLRCCSVECERGRRERKDNLAAMAEVGIEPAAKRQCEACGIKIPKWRNGRRVSSKTRFCSAQCQRTTAKTAQDTRNAVLGAKT